MNTLTVSQLIEILERLAAKKGDLPVLIATDHTGKLLSEIDDEDYIRIKDGAVIIGHSDDVIKSSELKEYNEEVEEKDEITEYYEEYQDNYYDDENNDEW